MATTRIAAGRNISQAQLLCSVLDNIAMGGTRFAFLLGAGASSSSGIGTAAELAAKWAQELEAYYPEALQSIDTSNMASAYAAIYQARFAHNPADGYRELMSLAQVEPSLGYVLLAHLLRTSAHNLVLTVNFDCLVEMALLTVFNHQAKVIYNESTLQVADVFAKEPTIVKTYADALLQPASGANSARGMSAAWQQKIDDILAGYHLIVLGYGGNDQERLLQRLVAKANKDRVYWCYQNESDIPDAVVQQEYFCVAIEGFDEFMFALNGQLPSVQALSVKSLSRQIREVADSRIRSLSAEAEKIAEPAAAAHLKITFTKHQDFDPDTWLDVQRKIGSENDTEAKDELYQLGLMKFPESSELTNNYALFLHGIGEDYAKAERYYQQALELDPDNAISNSNYALFLQDIRQSYDQAESYYQKALELDNDRASINASYASFLHEIRQEYRRAEHYYRRALRLDPNNAISNGNYANFLYGKRRNYDRAEHYYRIALKLEPNNSNSNGNYAGLLLARGRRREALEFLTRAEQLSVHPSLNLELAFYRLAHFPKSYEQSKAKILALLAEGGRSVGWDFSENIARAEQDGCTYIRELRELARRIASAN